jgi:hypothetical protein
MDAVQLLRKQIAERSQKANAVPTSPRVEESNSNPPLSISTPVSTPSSSPGTASNKLEELRKQIAERNKASSINQAPIVTDVASSTSTSNVKDQV